MIESWCVCCNGSMYWYEIRMYVHY